MNVERILKTLGKGFVSLSDNGFAYGPSGLLLLRNIERNWFQNCVTMPRHSVFMTRSTKIKETLEYLEESNANSLPFGLAAIENCKTGWKQDNVLNGSVPESHRVMKVKIVSDRTVAKDLFHRKQRERKVWWRKFARYPSRFLLTEVKKIKNCDSIEIQAQFPFGDITVETLSYWHDAKPILQDKKSALYGTHVIEHVASMDWGCLALLCDGYKENGDFGELRVHPKLSPYKVAFHIAYSDSEELSDLAVFLNNQLRAAGLDTVVSMDNHGVQTFRVPFVVIVDEDSLKSGIVRVESQLTTLAQKVHATDLIKHIATHCN